MTGAVHIDFGTQLVPVPFEQALLGADITDEDGRWRQGLRGPITFDLSRIEWTELRAMVQLVLVVEFAARAGIPSRVVLPSRTRLAGERDDSGAERRTKAWGFLEHMRFAHALRAPHFSSPGWVQPEIMDQAEGAGRTEGLYRYEVPLTWVTSEDPPTALRTVARHLAGVIRPREGLENGVCWIDHAALSNVLLHEIAQNTFEHAYPADDAVKTVLIAGGLRTSPRGIRNHQYLNGERRYIAMLPDRAVLDIVIGDSGNGIAGQLEPVYEEFHPEPLDKDERLRAVLLWAFDRLSSSKHREKRGTRGLYRVRMLTREFDALLRIRSGKELVGKHDTVLGETNMRSGVRELPSLPGTVLHVWLPVSKPLEIVPIPLVPDETSYEFVRLGQPASEGLTDKDYARVRRAVGRPAGEAGRAERCLVFQLEPVSLDPETAKEAVRNTLEQLADFRGQHPLVVTGLPGGWELVKGQCESLAADAGRLHIEKAAVGEAWLFKPILVLNSPPDGVSAWAGADRALEPIYTALLRQELVTADEMAELAPSVGVEERVARLRKDAGLVQLAPDGSARLRISLHGILEAAGERFTAEVAAAVRTSEQKKPVFVTPSLARVRPWLSATDLIQSAGCDLLPLWALARRAEDALSAVRDNLQPEGRGPSWLRMITDSPLENKRAQTLAKLLRCAAQVTAVSAEPSLGVPDTSTGFTRNDPVVIYTDILGSGETVRRSIARVLRAQGDPVAILCLVDGRTDDADWLEVWGRRVPVYSLAKQRLELPDDAPGPRRYVDAVQRRHVSANTAKNDGFDAEELPISPETLREVVRDQQAVAQGHFGQPEGRHFTYYLGPHRLLADSRIKEALRGVVAEWWARRDDDARNFNVWYPSPEPADQGSPARDYADLVAELPGGPGSPMAIVRRDLGTRWVLTAGAPELSYGSNLVIVDRGALGGSTISQMLPLALEAGARRILVVIALSQLPREQERLLRAIRSLGLPQLQPVPVEVRFLSRMPLHGFDPTACPVCHERSRLLEEQERDDTPAMDVVRSYRAARAEALELRPRDAAFGTSQYAEGAEKMLQLVGQFEAAAHSTPDREQVLEAMQEARKQPDLALQVVRLLDREPHRLHIPPLEFSRLREPIAELALGVALSSNPQHLPEDRAAAVRVLRAAAKRIFIGQAPAILRATVADEAPRTALLHGLSTLAAREYLAKTPLMEELREKLEELLSIALRQEHLREVQHALRFLLTRVNRRISTVALQARDLMYAWHQVRVFLAEEFPFPHHDMGDQLLAIGPTMIELEARRGPTEVFPRWIDVATNASAQLHTLMEEKLLPLLHRFRAVLETHPARQSLDPSRAATVQSVLAREGEWELPRLLQRLKSRPELVENESFRLRYRAAYDQLALLLEATPPEGKPAVARFLETLVFPVGPAIDLAVRRFRASNEDAPKVHVGNLATLQTKVLFTPQAFDTVVNELLDNARKRAIDGQAEVHLDWGREDGRLKLIVRCRGTSPTVGPPSTGHGLSICQTLTAAHEGALTEDPPEPGWTHHITWELLCESEGEA